MKNIFTTEEDIHTHLQKGRDFRMSDSVRTRIQEELSAYADMHNVPLVVPSPYRFAFTSFSYSRKSVYSFLMLLLLIGTSAGSAFASEKTLPGDVLYPIKIKVTEPVRTALTPSVKAKASWEAELAARRLQEATELAVAQKLDSETGSFLTEQFSEHVASTLAAADTLSDAGDTEGSADVRSALEARVTAHAAILTLVANHVDATDTALAVRDIAEEASVTQVAITRERVALETETAVVTEATSTPEEVPHTEVAVDAVPTLMTATLPTEVLEATTTEDGTASTTETEAPEMRSMPVQKMEREEVVASPKEETPQVNPEVKKREAARAAEIANILKKNSSLLYALSLGNK